MDVDEPIKELRLSGHDVDEVDSMIANMRSFAQTAATTINQRFSLETTPFVLFEFLTPKNALILQFHKKIPNLNSVFKAFLNLIIEGVEENLVNQEWQKLIEYEFEASLPKTNPIAFWNKISKIQSDSVPLFNNIYKTAIKL